MKYSVSVVVPNWNGREFIGDCLQSLEKQGLKAEIIVVDNGSADGSAEYVRKHFSDVTLLQLDENYGFAGGVNRGIELAMENGAEYIALFNNDAVADKDWLKMLVDTIKQQPHAGIVTGKLMRTDKKHLDSTGEFIHKNSMPFSRGRDEIDSGQYDKASYVFGATGGATLYRAAMLKEIGLFDEDYFAYFEDVDISFRAQLRGWRVYYQPAAVAYHHIGKTSSKLGSFRRYHSIKNYIYLYNKNMPPGLYWQNKPRFFWQLMRMFGGSIRDRELWAFVRSFTRALIMMPRTISKRRTIQQSATVDAAYIRQFIDGRDE